MKSRPSLLMRIVVWVLMRSGSDLKGKRFPRWRRQIENSPLSFSRARAQEIQKTL